jgi:hypothetical protein
VFTALQRGTVFDNDGNLLFADQSRASLPGLAANALDMSHEARIARAKEMGFDTDTTWFHGTNAKEFDAFEPGTRGASFFSDQPYLTDYFSNPSRSSDGTSRVIPAHTKANKLFDPARDADNPDLASYISENIRRYDVESILDPGKTWTKTPEEVLSELRGSSFGKDMFEPVEHPVVQEWIKRNGYDGFVTDDGSWMANAADKPARVMGVFDPRNIRSINAAFDPSKADSANLLAADQSRGSAVGMVANALDEPRGITAYHGSPHDFDKFSMDKIGTGEGAQAYGHGLYFAENEGVARNYKAALSKPESVRAFPSAEDAKQFGEPVPDGTGGFAAKLGDGSYVTDGAGGRMYEVRINADPEDFLDWDKPLSQQSKPVRDAVKELRPDEQTVRMISDLEAKEASGAGNYASRMLLARLKKRFGSHAVEQDVRGSSIMSDERAAALLRDSGIPGIRYLDQGSRGAGEGSRNYVLFRDDIIEIVKKYGIAAAASMYGMSQVQDAMASEGP